MQATIKALGKHFERKKRRDGVPVTPPLPPLPPPPAPSSETVAALSKVLLKSAEERQKLWTPPQVKQSAITSLPFVYVAE